MRNLVFALALFPAVSHAALLVDGGVQKDTTAPPIVGKAVIVPDAPHATITPAPSAAGSAPPLLTPQPAAASASMKLAAVITEAPPAIDPVIAATPTPEIQFQLRAGQSLEIQLMQWAKRAGWTLTWNTPDDWIVPGDKAFGSDFVQAAQSVFENLGNNGADIRADFWVGNRSIVVDQAGAIE
ncbi:TcpQ domain-containing protein [Paraburkholderia sp. A3RO-2L]|uniref:TcpQ domain-containing protein n=1 Tax=Paraburkholderia sp. A3RO-2L TaxID=3028376 RepID=UPI003DA9C3E0